MQLQPNDVHVWSTNLTIQPEQEQERLACLSPDECMRANRFRFALHRQRFIAARGALRQILCLYLNIAPQKMVFAYTEHHKPSLLVPNSSPIQFNLAHSHDIAVYAITLNQAIGIDIEKIRDTYNPAIAERYFSPAENAHLRRLPENERILHFYRLWSRKEAIIKAIGKGFTMPLTTFTVAANDTLEMITIQHETWSLTTLAIHPDYACALASHQMINTVSHWRLLENGHKIIATSNIFPKG